MKIYSVTTVCLALITSVFGAIAPAAFWQFESVTGFLADSSSNARTLLNSGGVTGAPGLSGQAAWFSGNNRLSVDDSPIWHSPKFTVEAYFRPSVVGTGLTQVIVSHHNNNSDQRGWYLGEAEGKLRFRKSMNGISGQAVEAFSLSKDHDYYAAAILDTDAQTVRLVLKDFTAGTPVESRTLAIAGPTFDANAPLAIGASGTQPGGTSFFTGAIDNVRFTAEALSPLDLQVPFVPEVAADRTKANGYKGIWFTLGQFSAYGDKYSGGLGTYTVNHSPIAIYSPKANKTFFTYGGTVHPAERRLVIMAGEYDHATHTVTKPTVVLEKVGVNDPHDNAAISIDNAGYIWVFISGRNSTRKAFTYRSAEPYSVDGFIRISAEAGEDYTYPQVWHDPVKGFFHLLTRYNGNQRELFFRTSPDGVTWSEVKPFAQFQGHYQVSAKAGDVIGTFFNRHPDANVDRRTDLYYMQTADFGQTWTNVSGTPLAIPLKTAANAALVMDYASQNRLVYGVDLTFDETGKPVIFYITSANYQPGPAGEPRTLHTARWTGTEWEVRDMPPSATALSTVTHNYAAGSLWIKDGVWTVIAPTGPNETLRLLEPLRFWGAGGELELWTSHDQGLNWTKTRAVTENSPRNHGYVRKPLYGTGRFSAYWADGNPASLSESHLYFSNAEGTRTWELPYDMTTDTAKPVEVNPPFSRWQKSNFDPISAFADPTADPDGDGQSNLVEYAQGTDPNRPNASGFSALADGDLLRLSVSKNADAFDVFQQVQASDDLETWQDIKGELLEFPTTEGRKFYRLRYELDR